MNDDLFTPVLHDFLSVFDEICGNFYDEFFEFSWFFGAAVYSEL